MRLDDIEINFLPFDFDDDELDEFVERVLEEAADDLDEAWEETNIPERFDSKEDFVRQIIGDLREMFNEESEDDTEGDRRVCKDCNGKGIYKGLSTIEDPCKNCGGAGYVR